MDDIPDKFICPISQDVMVYPFVTAAGNSYEYFHISKWLEQNDTDPLTRMKLENKIIYPNNTLRSHIRNWFEQHKLDMPTAEKPPKEAYNAGKQYKPYPNIEKVLKYRGKVSRKTTYARIPEAFSAFNHKYTFSKKPDDKYVYVQCDNGPAIKMPDKEMFVTAQGIVFYDASEVRDTLVLPGTNLKDPCKFNERCTNPKCTFAHPFVCPKGVSCTCKLLHPEKSSIVPIGTVYPLTQECRYKTKCTIKNCKFAHPRGRLQVNREVAKLYVTHSLTLQQLPQPIEMKLDVPKKAERFQFQGEFIFFFVPYPGTYAKEHYQTVIAHRFDEKSFSYKEVGTYSLDKHYCNCVVGSGKYMVISFWPFEDEAVRACWENIRITRQLEKEIKKKDFIIKEKNEEISELKQQISKFKMIVAEQSSKISYLGQENAQTRQALQAERSYTRDLRQQYERERNERLRLRDPIHIYVLQENCSGYKQDDWKLVLDYHKGAHDLRLCKGNGVQQLEITEHANVFQFDLVELSEKKQYAQLFPLVPDMLCEDF